MSRFPDQFRFRHQWRPYQQRVLDEFQCHLADRHFHIAAAPGAGKTVLGLEALRRLQQPALVLAPTMAIRDQWLSRLRQLFLPDAAPTDWMSDDLNSPQLITVTTYQALHSVQRKAGLSALLATLRSLSVSTLVLDEAHHLRHHWWRCLIELKKGLEAPWLIALTATPPYDVPQLEWNRYIELCGPLDAEVAVPELVKAGNLCPHQDYVYFTRPTQSETRRLQRFEQDVRGLLNDLFFDPGLLEILTAHPLVQSPQRHLSLLTEHSDFALSLALFLHQRAAERCRDLMHCLGLTEIQLPAMHAGWMEIMLNGLLFQRELMPAIEHPALAQLGRRLRQLGAIERRQVYLHAPPRLLRLLEGSRSKCQSVADIIELESRHEPHRMRAVILCDHIRESDFPEPGQAMPSFQHIGVVPVFEQLRVLRLPDVRLGILTGSLVVIPATVLAALRAILNQTGLDGERMQGTPLWHAPEYLALSAAGIDSGALLAAMTRLLENGDINVVIGTAALLGEGWDAPALNTLILASSIRASMRSNQMRGRAIRIQAGNPDKSANIWHLACLLPTNAADDPSAPPAGADMQMLSQRFRSFSGVGSVEPIIENGIDRLRLDPQLLRQADTDALNASMCAAALDRFSMRKRWQLALHDSADRPKRLVLETQVPLRQVRPGLRFAHQLRWQRMAWLRWLQAQWLKRQLRGLATALLRALQDQQLIASANASIEVVLAAGHIGCRLHGSSTHEESLFAECLREVFDLPQSPRYLLRRGKALYAVPACLGGRKERAEQLRLHASGTFTACELVYTRNESGRLILLQARERWIADRFEAGCSSRLLWA